LLRGLWTVTGFRRACESTAPVRPMRQLQIERIYFCSRALRDLTVAAGIEVAHGAVIHCPVDTGRFDGAPRAASRPMRRLIWVGRLTPDKGLMTALKAMALVRGRYPGELSVYGAGDAGYVKELKAFVEQESLPVTFGHVSRPELMPSIYAEHDALLFTSEWAEPFALTPLEAMACGLPVIGTTTGGSAELFRDGCNARTYAAGCAEELAARIIEMDEQPDQRAAIARAGFEEVRRRFAEPVIVDQIEDYLRETLELRRGAEHAHA
jgi:glycogen synthase